MKFTCPCCGYKTFDQPACGSYDLCVVCLWEDDEIQLNDPDYAGGANRVSLRRGQKNFLAFGAKEKRLIRDVRPRGNYLKDEMWKPLE